MFGIFASKNNILLSCCKVNLQISTYTLTFKTEKATIVADSMQEANAHLLQKISDTYALKHNDPGVQ
jgi:hypothetical protein